jgi:cell division protein FtsI (penicillin-binding protein 3)
MSKTEKLHHDYAHHVSVGHINKKEIADCKQRLVIVIFLFFMGFSVISLRLFSVALVKHEPIFISSSRDNKGYNRAEVVDRNGVLLATNLDTASLYANPRVMIDVDEAVAKILSVFPELNEHTLEARFASDRQFVWVKRNLTPIEQQSVNSLGIPGLYFRKEKKRVYPHKNLVSHVLGYTDVDGKGIAGIEKEFQSYLAGYNNLGETNEPLRLSLDVRVQGMAYRSLKRHMDTFKAKAGTAIVMDVTNGELISMVSLPDFDPHNASDASDYARFNRASLGVYEMGSTFKTFNMALGLESQVVKLKDEFDVSKPIKAANFVIKDYHPKKKILSTPEVFMYSSNIASAKIAMNVGQKKQQEFLRQLGLFNRVEVELSEKALPLIPQRWNQVSTMTVSYGHGIAVTPLHIAKATSALVNGGVVYPLTLVKEKNGVGYKGRRIISSDTSGQIRRFLRYAVSHGTGKNAEVERYLVGGKTGTADKVLAGGYDTSATLASFVGVFPMHQPKYLVFVMLDEPVGNRQTGGYATGGMIAAPVVKEIITKMAPIMNVHPVDEESHKIRREFFFYEDESGTPHYTTRSF